jgi:hypothetical protein
MTREENIEDFRQMYESLTNPDIIEANKQKADRQKRIEEKKADTGAYVL